MNVHPRDAQRLVTPGPRRFILPGMCAVFTAAFLAYALYLPSTRNDQLGPIREDQAALLAGFCFFVLAAITTVLALMPHHHVPDEPEVEEVTDPEAFDIVEPPPVPGDRDNDKIHNSLMRAANRHYLAAREASKRAVSANALAAATQRELDELRDGTSPEGQELRERILAAAHQESLDRISEFESAQAGLIESLRAGKQAAETEAGRLKCENDALRAEIQDARVQAVVEDRDRLQRTYYEIHEQSVETLDGPARDAVEAHTERIAEAFDRLHPAPTPAPAQSPTHRAVGGEGAGRHPGHEPRVPQPRTPARWSRRRS